MNINARAAITLALDNEGNFKFSVRGSLVDITEIMINGNTCFFQLLVEEHGYSEAYAADLVHAAAKIGSEKGRKKVRNGPKNKRNTAPLGSQKITC